MPEDRRVIEVMAGAQAGFVASTAPFPGYFAGRRGGKTSASVIKMMRYMTTYPGAYFMFTVPTLGDVERILLPKMREFFGAFYGTLWEWKEKKSQFEFPQHRGKDGEGGIAFVRPASEPDSMRGPTLAAAAMDEIAIENQLAAFEYLGPAVFGGQKGFPHQIWVTSTPKAERKWIGQIWRDHIAPDGTPLNAEDYPIFRSRTADNYHNEQASIDLLFASSARNRLEEFEGEFLSSEGIALPMLDAAIHLKYPPEGTEFVRTVFGYDKGGTSPTALVQWKMDRQLRKYAVSEFYKRDADEYDWVKWLADRNATRVMCDPAIGEVEQRYLARRNGLHFVPATAAKTHEMRLTLWRTGLTHDVRPPSIFISPDCPMLWDELNNLQHKKKGEDDWAENWASGVQDHAFDAGAYGLLEFDRFKLALPQPAQLVGAVR
jgi:hypothetical protein